MMRALFGLVLLLALQPVQAGEFWSSLWLNADQRGDQLLQQGDAGAAAKTYADSRRKAYAKLKAGDYAGAASDFAQLHSSDDDYNRGNALAHAGDLQAALEAYDAALKADPNNQDAKHNRKLVAEALKQQPPQQQDGKQGSQPQSGKEQDQQKPGQQGEQKPGDGKSSPAEQSGQQDSANKTQAGNAQQADKNNSAGDDKHQSQAGAAQANENAVGKDDATQARKDAAASLELGKNLPGKIKSQGPRTEQQIAQEQWLRSIPDDPGGLLRRKFLIEHLMRQQQQ